jgi:hypothetical protein
LRGELRTVGRETTYNGFANYETWLVALWLGNEYETYRRWQCISRDEWVNARRQEPGQTVPRELAASAVANRLKDEVEDASPLTAASLYSDLLRATLSEVDWYEVAENLLDDVTEEERP